MASTPQEGVPQGRRQGTTIAVTHYRCGPTAAAGGGTVTTVRWEQGEAVSFAVGRLAHGAAPEVVATWPGSEARSGALSWHRLVAAWSRVALPGLPRPLPGGRLVAALEGHAVERDVAAVTLLLEGYSDGAAASPEGLYRVALAVYMVPVDPPAAA